MKLNSKREVLDFGFHPDDTEHHFIVYNKPGAKEVLFFEQFSFDPELDFSTLSYSIGNSGSTCKCMLNVAKWDMISNDVRAEFNRRLKDVSVKSAQWKKSGYTYLHRLFGKEIMVLVWAIEDADPGTIPLAVQNWLGLKPEERWWLYTITNAATGHAINGRGKGWRKALRFALTENPVTADRIDMNLYKNADLPDLFNDDSEMYGFGSKKKKSK